MTTFYVCVCVYQKWRKMWIYILRQNNSLSVFNSLSKAVNQNELRTEQTNNKRGRSEIYKK